MPHERLQKVTEKLREKAAAERRKQKKRAADRRARERRIERKEPEGATEEVRVTATEAAEAKSAAGEFVGETRAGRAAKSIVGGASSASKTAAGAVAKAADKLEPPDEGQMVSGMDDVAAQAEPRRAVVADENTTVLTPSAALYSQEVAPLFDRVTSADTDGVIEAKDVRAAVDIDGDGAIEAGEEFRPTSAPSDLEDVPRRESQRDDPLDDILI